MGLKHQGIPKIIEYGHTTNLDGVADGTPFFSMEFIEGVSLFEWSRSGRTVSQKVEKCIELLKIVECVHKKEFFHRDIKPLNIMLKKPDFSVVLIDYGMVGTKNVSKLAWEVTRKEFDNKLTMQGLICGSPSYLSPEQAKAQNKEDFPTDIYSVGVILYEMLSGDAMFPEPSSVRNKNKVWVEIVANVEAGRYEDLHKKCPELDVSLVNIWKAMVDLNPARRPSAKDAIKLLSGYLEKQVISDTIQVSDDGDFSAEDTINYAVKEGDDMVDKVLIQDPLFSSYVKTVREATLSVEKKVAKISKTETTVTYYVRIPKKLFGDIEASHMCVILSDKDGDNVRIYPPDVNWGSVDTLPEVLEIPLAADKKPIAVQSPQRQDIYLDNESCLLVMGYDSGQKSQFPVASYVFKAVYLPPSIDPYAQTMMESKDKVDVISISGNKSSNGTDSHEKKSQNRLFSLNNKK
ncbi:MAG: putative serine/threonine protein kinase [Parcubacteria group bacterium Gr01-1014_18]|nr:MAG: putative serine/threonine protein kinase [Parcubacteria group bacterium Greene0416_36]TSC81224.1 MAG: putative serine/threonine protein kinase [Parcubacteria group bacterium Gr01-1014_18]TSC99221.1 MAG: putative serine/threonine protein kinase [Parcubacteria group bacterium Greene1014_20]TSD07421.1 MAG: putative serine/threonine protein kinase [Parcubacteria group bacterium Greene0714_2]